MESITFKPNYLKTPEEKAEVARRFDNLHKRPDTSDYQWLDDCDRRKSKPKKMKCIPICVALNKVVYHGY